MHIWALADLHLTISTPEKTMEVFGAAWKNYQMRIRENWSDVISEKDLVLLPGDISWAMTLEKAKIDLQWIDELPGIKVMIKGNHDYWWDSITKMEKIRPPSIHFIQNNSFFYEGVAVGGSRLWDSDEYAFGALIDYIPNSVVREDTRCFEDKIREDKKVFERELNRLELSLQSLKAYKNADLRIAMVHYPPIGIDLQPTATSRILESHKIDVCTFGHLHNVKEGLLNFGSARGVEYHFCAADYLQFKPLQIR